MMWLKQLTSPNLENDLFTRLRVRFIQVLAVTGIILSVIGIVYEILQKAPVYALVVTTVFFIVNAGLLVLVSRRYIALAALLVVTLFVITALVSPGPFVLMAVLALVSAATLVSVPLYVLTNIIVFGFYIYKLIQTPLNPDGSISQAGSAGLVILFALIVVSSTTRYFVDTAQKAVQSARRNAFLLQSTAEIGQVAATTLDLNQILSRSAELIRDRFAYYHVQIYLIDLDEEQAVLAAATGDEGRQLIANRHKIPVGSATSIGRAVQSAQAVVIRDNDLLFQRNPLLPLTHIEAALPIFEGNQVIGILDAQSARYDVFHAEDIQALQTTTSLLATAIRNARLFEAQNKVVQEKQRLLLDSEANLREIQRLNQQLTRAGWNEYLEQPSATSGVTLGDSQMVTDATWTETLIQATRSRRPVVDEANGKSAVVAVPVVLRGEVIGAIEVEPGEEVETANTLDMVQAVAQRLAISLDNARLFEEAQAATAQEQRINQIVTRYQSASSVDDLLRITLTELSQTLGAQRGAIRLGNVDAGDHQNGVAP
jgi:GAF domain-containing protein